MTRVIIRILFALVCVGLGYAFFPELRGAREAAEIENAHLAGMVLGLNRDLAVGPAQNSAEARGADITRIEVVYVNDWRKD